mgnify:CR=1 FL=1
MLHAFPHSGAPPFLLTQQLPLLPPPALLNPDGCTHVLVLATRPAVQHTTLQRYVRGTVVWAVKKTVLNAPYMSEAWASDLAEEGVLHWLVVVSVLWLGAGVLWCMVHYAGWWLLVCCGT